MPLLKATVGSVPTSEGVSPSVPKGAKPPCSQAAEGGVLVDSLLEAGDLLSEVVDLVFQVLFPAANAGVAGFDDGAEAVYGLDYCSAQEACGKVDAAEGRFAGRACC